MKWKSLPIFLMIFLGLFLYILLFDRDLPDTLNKQKNQKRLFSFQSETIDQITIKNKHGVFDLKKDTLFWNISNPINARADRSRVESILSELELLEYVRTVSDDLSMKEAGLTDPTVEVTLTWQGKKISLIVGNATAIGSNVYVLTDRVYAVDRMILEHLDVGIDGLRSKKVIHGISSEVNNINIFRDGLDIVVAKKNDWMIMSPVKRLADGRRINQIIKTFRNLKVLDYIEDSPDVDLNRYGLSESKFSVQLSGVGYQVRLFVGDVYLDDRVYLKNSLEQNIYGVERKSLNLFRSSLFELSRKKVFFFGEKDIKKIEISDSSEAFVMEYLDSSWQIVDPVKVEADSGKILSFLNDLKTFDILEYIHDRSIVDKLTKECSLKISSIDKTILYEFYSNGGVFYILLDDDQLFKIKTADNKIPKKMIYFVNPDFIKTNKYTLNRLLLKVDDREITVYKKDDRWFLDGTVLSDETIEEFLREFKKVKPDRIVSPALENELKKYGLAQSKNKLVISFSEEVGERKIIINLGRTENDYIYANKEDYPLIFTIKKSTLDKLQNILSLR